MTDQVPSKKLTSYYVRAGGYELAPPDGDYHTFVDAGDAQFERDRLQRELDKANDDMAWIRRRTGFTGEVPPRTPECQPLLHVFTEPGQPCRCGAVQWGQPSNTPVPSLDPGPWEILFNPSEKRHVGVVSDQFKYDVCLRVSGDFPDDEERRQYCVWLAETLNRTAQPPGVECSHEEHEVFCGTGYCDISYGWCKACGAIAEGGGKWRLPQLGASVPAKACDCWEAINALIKSGELPGNGWDPSAERNGLILAANALFAKRQPPRDG